MVTFTKQTVKKLIVAGNKTNDVHQEYLRIALGLPAKPSHSLSDSDDKRQMLIDKLRENGFTEISGDILENYSRVYSNTYYIREGLVMQKEGHKLLVNVLKAKRWDDPAFKLFEIDTVKEISLSANKVDEVVKAVDNYEKTEEEWKTTWSIEEVKLRKSMEVNQKTLDMVLKGIVKKHKWTYSIEKDHDGRTTLLVRISGKRQVSMKFKKDVSTEVITKVAEVVSQLVDIIKNNNDIEIMVRGISIYTKWEQPE